MKKGFTPRKRKMAQNLGKREHYARRVARLCKILDQRDSVSLVYAYQLYPDDISEDLAVIELATSAERISDIFELLDWYRYKSLADIAGTRNCLRPKEELSIFTLCKKI